ncbi:hypothetical protein JM93_03512 [Roseibium hamelinense]|uniref:Uncharacterized protein n=1 Tax=Roseibium hamelinense TaxID=150831 RepID=A0A562SM08_9HYPH|nr:hypothetical protein [Roseibium hamelinense]TWI82168.1 hypothetical protein JM93_03512 [Roseibium hamelinense]
MTYLAQMLGTNLMGAVNGRSVNEIARMDKALRQSAYRKTFKFGSLLG